MSYSPVYDPLPGMEPDLDPGLCDPGIGGEEVLWNQETKLLWAGDSVLLGQDVHGVLLAVRGDDVRVVSCLIILKLYIWTICILIATMSNLGAVEGEETEHLDLLDGEDGASLGHV